MIRRQVLRDGQVKLTFSLTHDDEVALISDIDGWDPAGRRLQRRSNGTRSVAVTVPAGAEVRFRYASNGDWFDDTAADRVEPNGFGQTHAVVVA